TGDRGNINEAVVPEDVVPGISLGGSQFVPRMSHPAAHTASAMRKSAALDDHTVLIASRHTTSPSSWSSPAPLKHGKGSVLSLTQSGMRERIVGCSADSFAAPGTTTDTVRRGPRDSSPDSVPAS